MARTALTVQESGRSADESVTQAAADTVNGNYFDNDSEKVLLVVNNDSGSSCDVTIDTPITFDGISIPALVVTVGIDEVAVIGPFLASRYSQEDTDSGTQNAVFIDADQAAKLTAVKFGPTS